MKTVPFSKELSFLDNSYLPYVQWCVDKDTHTVWVSGRRCRMCRCLHSLWRRRIYPGCSWRSLLVSFANGSNWRCDVLKMKLIMMKTSTFIGWKQQNLLVKTNTDHALCLLVSLITCQYISIHMQQTDQDNCFRINFQLINCSNWNYVKTTRSWLYQWIQFNFLKVQKLINFNYLFKISQQKKSTHL